MENDKQIMTLNTNRIILDVNENETKIIIKGYDTLPQWQSVSEYIQDKQALIEFVGLVRKDSELLSDLITIIRKASTPAEACKSIVARANCTDEQAMEFMNLPLSKITEFDVKTELQKLEMQKRRIKEL
ncbi:MAG: hypothetical protein MJZ75_04905 [Paludibacteraceae bacterium]|nr:hypothetical protein [Paludibacteraceae bacterium]